MGFSPKSEEEEARAITQLVDGSASDSERRALEVWARERPGIARQVALQRRIAEQLRTGGPPVPPRLVGAIRERAGAADRSSAGTRRAPSTRSAARWRPAFAAAAIAAVVAIVVGLQLGGPGGNRAPSITRAAQLAYSPATQSAPAAKTAKLLDVSYAGITYPNYAREFGLLPTGQRLDRLGGRPALTVFYRFRNGTRLSYTVFSGKPVALPAAARSVVFDGVPLHVYVTSSRLAVVTLVRFGRTCVLAAPTARDAVLALAAAPVRADRA
jgi:hypothetical protein